MRSTSGASRAYRPVINWPVIFFDVLETLARASMFERRIQRTGPGQKTLYTLHKRIGTSKYTPALCRARGCR